MLEKLKELTQKFLEQSKDKDILVVSHFDTDGITSAAIMASCLKRLNKNFSLRIVKQLEKELGYFRDSEMWQAGAAVRSLRPENWKK